ncbi:MAG: exodeoxyribonuclease VII small subunit [Desulfovibrionaceae bacterium]|nr:exodeoxyribonuclease VII small subunit [Desulfovibrionaceae bacterium]
MSEQGLDDFETKLARLQEIVKNFDSGNLSLQKGMDMYKEGVECAKACRTMLNEAQHQLTIWQNEEEKALELTQVQNA